MSPSNPSLHLLAEDLYRTILDFFRQHHRIPTQDELAQIKHVGKYSIRKRIAWLQAEGRIKRRSNIPVEIEQWSQET